MTWDAIAWQPAEAGLLEATPVLAMWPMLKSALEEAVAASIQGPASVGDLLAARVDAADLPPEFAPVASIELLGTERRAVWAAFAPDEGAALGGLDQTPAGLQAILLDGLDGVLQAVVGEGLNLATADGLAPLAGNLHLIRLPIRDVSGTGVDAVIAVEASVPGELTAHVVALQALSGDGPALVDVPPPTAAPVAPPVSAPAVAPVVEAAPTAPAQVPPAAPIPVRPMHLPELATSAPAPGSYNIELLLGVNLEVSVEIGRTRLPIRDVLSLAPGSVIELDKLAGEKVDVLVNGRPIASGEVVVVDENFGVRITEVVSRQHRILSADAAR